MHGRIIRRVGLIQDRGTSRKVNIKKTSSRPFARPRKRHWPSAAGGCFCSPPERSRTPSTESRMGSSTIDPRISSGAWRRVDSSMHCWPPRSGPQWCGFNRGSRWSFPATAWDSTARVPTGNGSFGGNFRHLRAKALTVSLFCSGVGMHASSLSAPALSAGTRAYPGAERRVQVGAATLGHHGRSLMLGGR